MNEMAHNPASNGAHKPDDRAAAEAAKPAKPSIRPRDARQTRMGQAFAHIIAVLMRDPHYRKMRLADLEWLVLPPVMAGQFRLAQAPAQGAATTPGAGAKAQQGGMMVPVAVALWARVSPQVDTALAADVDGQVRLKVNEWASGDQVWMMVVGGDPRAVPSLLKQTCETDFEGRQVKMRMRGPDGKLLVKTLGQQA